MKEYFTEKIEELEKNKEKAGEEYIRHVKNSFDLYDTVINEIEQQREQAESKVFLREISNVTEADLKKLEREKREQGKVKFALLSIPLLHISKKLKPKTWELLIYFIEHREFKTNMVLLPETKPMSKSESNAYYAGKAALLKAKIIKIRDRDSFKYAILNPIFIVPTKKYAPSIKVLWEDTP